MDLFPANPFPSTDRKLNLVVPFQEMKHATMPTKLPNNTVKEILWEGYADVRVHVKINQKKAPDRASRIYVTEIYA